MEVVVLCGEACIGLGYSSRVLSQSVLDWPHSRKIFYWRLRRRLVEEKALKHIMEADR